jgi:hypothetical protein
MHKAKKKASYFYFNEIVGDLSLVYE